MNLLELNSISFSSADRKILAGLSLRVQAGEVHALLGTNGTGQSTLANLIMGCHGYQPGTGDIMFSGIRINDLKIHERARIGISMAWHGRNLHGFKDCGCGTIFHSDRPKRSRSRH